MREPIRLLIWDLDNTFWKGTLSEEGIDQDNHAADIVEQLTNRGILNSICSKNDFDVARKKLKKMGVWDYFVFPSINWESKGKRVASLLKKMKLRPETVMFIDDIPANREEVRHFCPGIQIEDESFVEEILRSPLFVGVDDAAQTRLLHYKIEEQKHTDRESEKNLDLNDYDFLRKSGIKIKIIYDLSDHKERIVELINRTNQLNFTKKRLSENMAEAIYDVERMIEHAGIFNHLGAIHVKDNYGDYGIVGFFHVVQNATDNFLIHFCFSCRTLGMHVETWVYRYLGLPALEVKGKVANNPIFDQSPVDWFQLVSSDFTDDWRVEEQGTYPIIMSGGCDIDSIRHYIKDCSTKIDVFTNTVRDNFIIRRDHSAMVRIGVEHRDAEQKTLRQCGYKNEDFFSPFTPEVEQEKWGLVVFSFWADAGFQIHALPGEGRQVAPYCPPQIGYGNFQDFYEEDYLRMGGTSTQIRHYRFAKANLRPLGLIGMERHKENLRAILRKVPPHFDVVLFTLPSKVPDLYPGSGTLERNQAVASWQYEVSEEFSNVRCVSFDRFIHSIDESHTYDHFSRIVYLRAGEYIRKLYRKKISNMVSL